MAACIAGSKSEAHNSPSSVSSMTPPARFPLPSSFPRKMPTGISTCCAACCAATASPSASMGTSTASWCATTTTGRSKNNLRGKRQPTQFGRALAQLGVIYIPANSPQAKGRIERLWGTFQDRLTSELRLVGAADLVTANDVLSRFLPDYNRRFGCAPRETEKAWRTAPKDPSRICCFVHERLVSNDNVVQWDGRRFQITPQPKRFSFAGAKVQLCESLRGSIEIYYGDSKLHHAH